MNPYIGLVAAFAYDLTKYDGNEFLPCDGRPIAVSTNQALYSLIGNIYGGTSTAFNLPDLRGRVIVGAGSGPGLTPRPLGRMSGAEAVVLTTPQIPAHNHPVLFNPTVPVAGTISAQMNVNNSAAGQNTPANNFLGNFASGAGESFYATTADGSNKLNNGAITVTNSLNVNLAAAQLNTGMTGASQPVKTMPPYLCLYYGIATTGTYPSQG